MNELNSIKLMSAWLKTEMTLTYFACIQFVAGSLGGNLLEHARWNILMGKLLEHLLSPLAHIARTGEHEGHGADGVGHQAQGDLVSRVPNALSGSRRKRNWEHGAKGWGNARIWWGRVRRLGVRVTYCTVA